MPKTTSNLNINRLREFARTGADVTLKRLGAEIIAIERAFPELRFAAGSTCAPQIVEEGHDTHSHDVSGGAQGGLCADEALLGGSAQGAGEGEVGPSLFRRHEALQLRRTN